MNRSLELKGESSGTSVSRTPFLEDVLQGLMRKEKAIPCKWLYDERGSRLFEKICKLSVYYPTRTEIAITRASVSDIGKLVGPLANLVELGSGSSVKTRILLDHLPRLHTYIPVDISREHLDITAKKLAREYPRLPIFPLAIDYHQKIVLPRESQGARSTAFYFPGSTIGNFEPAEAVAFLENLRALYTSRVGGGLEEGLSRGGLLIGVDLVKDESVIEAAYNDPEGVTAEFNRNLLFRIQRELGGRLDPHAFRHRARYEEANSRVVMQLVAMGRQSIEVGGQRISLDDGEAITTEHCYKYEVDRFARLAQDAGLEVRAAFYDERRWFGLKWLVPSETAVETPRLGPRPSGAQ